MPDILAQEAGVSERTFMDFRLGKPVDQESAERILGMLSGRLPKSDPVRHRLLAIREQLMAVTPVIEVESQNPFITLLLERIASRLPLLQERFPHIRFNQMKVLTQFVEWLKKHAYAPTPADLKTYFKESTGGGKTVTYLLLYLLLDIPTLILVPTKTLLRQTKREAIETLKIDEGELGLVGDGVNERGRKLTIMTYSSFLEMHKRRQAVPVEFVICDEIHTSLGDKTQASLSDILEGSDGVDFDMDEVFRQLEGQSRAKISIGGTATDALASKHVRDYFGERFCESKMADLIAAGVLKRYRLVPVSGTLEPQDEWANISAEREEFLVTKQRIHERLLERYVQFQGENSTLHLRTAAYCSTVKECLRFKELAEAKGLKALVVTGTEGKDDLEKAERGLLDGTVDLVISVDRLTLGWNFPPLNAVIWGRACSSAAKFVQATGRAARAYEGEPYAYVFETQWRVSGPNERKKGAGSDASDGDSSSNETTLSRKALSLAVALFLMGEDVEAVIEGFHSSPEMEALKQAFTEQKLTSDTAEAFEEMPVEDLRSLLRSSFPAQDWVKMIALFKGGIKIVFLEGRFVVQQGKVGVGMVSIARKFGLSGDPTTSHLDHVRLGAHVFGDKNPVIQAALVAAEKKALTKTAGQEAIRQRLLQDHPTATSWMAVEDRGAISVDGLGISTIATRLGVSGNPLRGVAHYIELGQKLHGADDPVYLARLTELEERKTGLQLSKEALVPLVLDQHPTQESWNGMGAKARFKFKVKGLGLAGLATRFGVEGDPVGHTSVHQELGERIYASVPVVSSQAETHLEEAGEDEGPEQVSEETSPDEEGVEDSAPTANHLNVAVKLREMLLELDHFDRHFGTHSRKALRRILEVPDSLAFQRLFQIAKGLSATRVPLTGITLEQRLSVIARLLNAIKQGEEERGIQSRPVTPTVETSPNIDKSELEEIDPTTRNAELLLHLRDSVVVAWRPHHLDISIQEPWSMEGAPWVKFERVGRIRNEVSEESIEPVPVFPLTHLSNGMGGLWKKRLPGAK